MKLPMEIMKYVNAYYKHRNVQETVPWDKTTDLKAIAAACVKRGWSWEACAGTFWFKKPTGKKIACFHIQRDNHNKPPVIKLTIMGMEAKDRSETMNQIFSAMEEHDKKHPEQEPYFLLGRTK